jgi:DNA repair protein RecO (recombination protein O)
MEHKTKGIIFHAIKYGESGLIVTIFTEDFGLQSFIINSVRGNKGKVKASVFQPLNLVELVFLFKENRSLQRIKEIRIQPVYHTVHDSVVKSSIVLFLNEILYKSIQEPDHPDHPLFDFIFHSLLILDLKQEVNPDFHLFFLIQLSKLLGFYPHGEYNLKTPYFDLNEGCFISSNIELLVTMDSSLSKVLYQLMNSNYETLNELKISGLTRKLLLNKLLIYFEIHLSSFKNIKSASILEEIFKV